MDKLDFANGLTAWNDLRFTAPRKLSPLATLAILIFSIILVPVTASAQPASADAAIETARQWLTLADSQQVDQMWEQSDALMKLKSEQGAWIKYVNDMRIRLGTSPSRRIWQSMEHQINNPSLPQGEFVGITFVSVYPKASSWERVSLIWKDEHWAPVGYQAGAVSAAAQ
ncbi:DUF4019 domain-containing protein [Collimonas fungivorans]|nr:DUF4019 domain-containing protein [Collimonas fungivorans]